ncbi:MAG TPA: hypothetical protein VLB76_29855 [Thermoanaerobaculia bacterium]|jgi:membrane protein implicated in regulation of membrane protease activity|nr:hypothetical protein [Thermoanaerobaculia bacterium]
MQAVLQVVWYLAGAVLGLGGGLLSVFGAGRLAFAHDKGAGAVQLALGIFLILGTWVCFQKARASRRRAQRNAENRFAKNVFD